MKWSPISISDRLRRSAAARMLAVVAMLAWGATRLLAQEPPPEKQTQKSVAAQQDPDAANENAQAKEFDLTFDDLAFKMEKTEQFKRSMLTSAINSYDGAKVRLRGYIRPSVSQTGLTKFVFVRDNKECCFGPGAALYDCVLVRLADGEQTDFTVRPVTIEGTFYLKEYLGPDDRVWSLYRMKDGLVK